MKSVKSCKIFFISPKHLIDDFPLVIFGTHLRKIIKYCKKFFEESEELLYIKWALLEQKMFIVVLWPKFRTTEPWNISLKPNTSNLKCRISNTYTIPYPHQYNSRILFSCYNFLGTFNLNFSPILELVLKVDSWPKKFQQVMRNQFMPRSVLKRIGIKFKFGSAQQPLIYLKVCWKSFV